MPLEISYAIRSGNFYPLKISRVHVLGFDGVTGNKIIDTKLGELRVDPLRMQFHQGNATLHYLTSDMTDPALVDLFDVYLWKSPEIKELTVHRDQLAHIAPHVTGRHRRHVAFTKLRHERKEERWADGTCVPLFLSGSRAGLWLGGYQVQSPRPPGDCARADNATVFFDFGAGGLGHIGYLARMESPFCCFWW
ncbi:hypothetical protein BX661DRAFT_171529 [Kickxella alabastrina]|uniref:uncharacterized protein n=1 Tax=Kickxella alabastrina TaxID=61397 RepID=UPI0022205264|nr:uncharacterized protein BX661DRAFT_171529 [Kickxella alabastrina]KAI7826244.1 hypothetical protein BX661DRAFT_171529 [Kickxella alabastrina]